MLIVMTYSEVDWSVTKARSGRDSRKKGCESGYYHLHRDLNQARLLHRLLVPVLESCATTAALVEGLRGYFTRVTIEDGDCLHSC